jgi:hypothetical protein
VLLAVVTAKLTRPVPLTSGVTLTGTHFPEVNEADDPVTVDAAGGAFA